MPRSPIYVTLANLGRVDFLHSPLWEETLYIRAILKGLVTNKNLHICFHGSFVEEMVSLVSMNVKCVVPQRCPVRSIMWSMSMKHNAIVPLNRESSALILYPCVRHRHRTHHYIHTYWLVLLTLADIWGNTCHYILTLTYIQGHTCHSDYILTLKYMGQIYQLAYSVINWSFSG